MVHDDELLKEVKHNFFNYHLSIALYQFRGKSFRRKKFGGMDLQKREEELMGLLNILKRKEAEVERLNSEIEKAMKKQEEASRELETLKEQK